MRHSALRWAATCSRRRRHRCRPLRPLHHYPCPQARAAAMLVLQAPNSQEALPSAAHQYRNMNRSSARPATHYHTLLNRSGLHQPTRSRRLTADRHRTTFLRESIHRAASLHHQALPRPVWFYRHTPTHRATRHRRSAMAVCPTASCLQECRLRSPCQ